MRARARRSARARNRRVSGSAGRLGGGVDRVRWVRLGGRSGSNGSACRLDRERGSSGSPPWRGVQACGTGAPRPPRRGGRFGPTAARLRTFGGRGACGCAGRWAGREEVVVVQTLTEAPRLRAIASSLLREFGPFAFAISFVGTRRAPTVRSRGHRRARADSVRGPDPDPGAIHDECRGRRSLWRRGRPPRPRQPDGVENTAVPRRRRGKPLRPTEKSTNAAWMAGSRFTILPL